LTWRALGIAAVAAVTGALAFRGFETRVAGAFEVADAVAPTRIYARPLVLRPGDRYSTEGLEQRLHRLGYRETDDRTPGIGEFRLRRDDWRIGRRPFRLGAYFDPGGETRVRLDRTERVSEVRDEGGNRLPGLVLDPEPVGTIGGHADRDRVPVRLSDVPDHLIDAILTAEDRRFRDHAGFDPRRMLGAVWANVRERRLAQGGSTLTQQLARTLFLSSDRKVLRKVREAAIALVLERRFSKDRLLEAYLNHIYVGQDGGDAIHGVGRAAFFFFDRDISEIGLEESAMLAGIIRGPNLYSPHRHPARARSRRDLVLRQMHDEGLISDARLVSALDAPLGIRAEEPPPGDARWYFDYLEREIESAFGGPTWRRAGASVVSTLEPPLQAAAEASVADQMARLERMYPRLAKQSQTLQAALVAIDPWTGEILAMVGGRSYGESQFNRAVDAKRQPGSAFKPVVALAALSGRGGRDFTLASVLRDEPLVLDTPAGPWRPRNADNAFLGPITLRQALEVSRNVPFARLGLEVGPDGIIETARGLGIASPLAPVPSLALGASEVSLLELTGAYAVLAAEGERIFPHAIRTVFGRTGERLGDPEANLPYRAFSPAEAYLVTSALKGVIDRGTGTAVRDAGYAGPVAAKSGTTNGARDAWFVGYTPEIAVGVWVGFDDGTPVGLTGSQAALPVFAGFLRAALGPDGDADFRVPDGVEWIGVDTHPEGRGFGRCEGAEEVFLVGTEPEGACYGGRLWRDLGRRQGLDALDAAERWLRSRLGDVRRTPRIDRRGRGGRDR